MVHFARKEFLAHHGISYLLLMHHERREQQQRLTATPVSAASHLRAMALGQRVVAPKKQQQVPGRLVIVRGTVVSVGKRHLPSSYNDDINKSQVVDDGNVYHIKYDDGTQDEMNGEELYGELCFFSKRYSDDHVY
jgi:hypothetical protein